MYFTGELHPSELHTLLMLEMMIIRPSSKRLHGPQSLNGKLVTYEKLGLRWPEWTHDMFGEVNDALRRTQGWQMEL